MEQDNLRRDVEDLSGLLAGPEPDWLTVADMTANLHRAVCVLAGKKPVGRPPGTPSKLTEETRQTIRTRVAWGWSISEIAATLRLSRTTVYKCLKEEGQP